MTDPTQGDVVEEVESLSRRVAGVELAVMLAPCAHCGQSPPPAFVALASMLQEVVRQESHKLSLDLAGIASRERARRAKAQ